MLERILDARELLWSQLDMDLAEQLVRALVAEVRSFKRRRGV